MHSRELALLLGMDKVRGVRDAAKAKLDSKDGKKDGWRGDIKSRAVCTSCLGGIATGLIIPLFRQD